MQLPRLAQGGCAGKRPGLHFCVCIFFVSFAVHVRSSSFCAYTLFPEAVEALKVGIRSSHQWSADFVRQFGRT